MDSQVISKQRVADHGEVLTGRREVNAMLDLMKQETERIDSRFLEPACGDGNFLAEILARKLCVVEARYGRSQTDYERNAVLAVSSAYGIDIQEDNVIACRQRLFALFDTAYTLRFKSKAKDGCRDAVRFILSLNIVWGDALLLKTGADPPQPIEFSEWSLVRGSFLKRRMFAFHELSPSEIEAGPSLFDAPLRSDQGEAVFIPSPLKEFPLTHYLKVADAEPQDA